MAGIKIIQDVKERVCPSPERAVGRARTGRPAVGFSMGSGVSYSYGRNLAGDFERILQKQTKVTKQFPEPMAKLGSTPPAV